MVMVILNGRKIIDFFSILSGFIQPILISLFHSLYLQMIHLLFIAAVTVSETVFIPVHKDTAHIQL